MQPQGRKGEKVKDRKGARKIGEKGIRDGEGQKKSREGWEK